MLLSVFLAGIVIGSMLYIPIGPNGLVALASIKSESYKGIIGTAIGSSLACFITALLSTLLILNFPVVFLGKDIINSISSIFLVLFGTYFIAKSVVIPETQSSPTNKLKLIKISFLVGISNPKSIIIFPTLLFSFYPSFNNSATGLETVLLLAFGAFLSAVMWWCVFYFSLRFVKIAKFPGVIEKITKVFGCILILVGIGRLGILSLQYF